VKILGLEDERIRLEWVSAAEGDRWGKVIDEFVGQITALGPSPLNHNPKFEEK
jgi:coenzyme F420-reducing hydrogenase delta subunit